MLTCTFVEDGTKFLEQLPTFKIWQVLLSGQLNIVQHIGSQSPNQVSICFIATGDEACLLPPGDAA